MQSEELSQEGEFVEIVTFPFVSLKHLQDLKHSSDLDKILSKSVNALCAIKFDTTS